MNTATIIELATKHLGGVMLTSAQLCLNDATYLYDMGDTTAARQRALASLKFSVGILHSAYREALMIGPDHWDTGYTV